MGSSLTTMMNFISFYIILTLMLISGVSADTPEAQKPSQGQSPVTRVHKPRLEQLKRDSRLEQFWNKWSSKDQTDPNAGPFQTPVMTPPDATSRETTVNSDRFRPLLWYLAFAAGCLLLYAAVLLKD